jgi:hypothetical protein
MEQAGQLTAAEPVPPARLKARLAAAGAVWITDWLVLPRVKSRVLAGLLDESAHLVTGSLAVAALPASSGRLARAALVGSVVLDADHVPDALGVRWLRVGHSRPVTHSLPGIAGLAFAAARLDPGPGRSEAAMGLLLGLGAHLTRDLATGTTAVLLLWPLSSRRFRIRYRCYAAAMMGAALAAGRRRA